MTKVCPNCENVVSEDVLICPYCSNVLSKPKKEAINTKKNYCPNCKKELFLTNGVCVSCGYDVEKKRVSNLNVESYFVVRAFFGACLMIPLSIILLIGSLFVIFNSLFAGLWILGMAVIAFLIGIICIAYYNANK